MSVTVTRRSRWQYPPPPTPRIIHLPRRPRRRQAAKSAPAPAAGDRRGKLEALFDQERVFTKAGVPIVLLECDEVGVDGGEEAEKWRFQAEMLRAECNFLRMEREVAVKRLERTRTQMERTLRSTVQTLITGRNKISDGETLGLVLDHEIEELAEKLEKLQRRSRDFDGRSCSNFDKQACLLQRRLEKIGGLISIESCSSEIREMKSNTRVRIDESFVSTRKCNDVQLEVLKKKMERMAKGMILEKMEEDYGSFLSTANNSASSSKRMGVSDMASTSARQPRRDTLCMEERSCSGRCKMIVRKIVEQVRVETEQWSEMQKMLGQVREEMEELQASRDFWEDRAHKSDSQVQTLHSNIEEWKQKTFCYESKAKKLEEKISQLQIELEGARKEEATKSIMYKHLSPNSREATNETEKRVLICRLKENRRNNDNSNKKENVSSNRTTKSSVGGIIAPKRSPFRDIGNSSDTNKSSKSVFPLHY